MCMKCGGRGCGCGVHGFCRFLSVDFSLDQRFVQEFVDSNWDLRNVPAATDVFPRTREVTREIPHEEVESFGQKLVGILALGSGLATWATIHELDEQRRYALSARMRWRKRIQLARDGAAVVSQRLRRCEVDDREAVERFAELGHQQLDSRLGRHHHFETDGIADRGLCGCYANQRHDRPGFALRLEGLRVRAQSDDECKR